MCCLLFSVVSSETHKNQILACVYVETIEITCHLTIFTLYAFATCGMMPFGNSHSSAFVCMDMYTIYTMNARELCIRGFDDVYGHKLINSAHY